VSVGAWHMRSLLWSYLGSRRFPREMSPFEMRRYFCELSLDPDVIVLAGKIMRRRTPYDQSTSC
jgi:hypothetical protein